MIIGRGLLGKALMKIDNDKYLFYVNGISNSVMEEIPDDNFEAQQIKEIAENIGDKTFIYLSTSQVNRKENFCRPYVLHKYKMEVLAANLFPNYIIVRTSNLVGNNPWNKHTLFNYLYNSLHEENEIHVNESIVRNILDVDHFVLLFESYLNNFLVKNCTIDLVNPVSFNMGEILNAFETTFSKKFSRNHLDDHFAYFGAPCILSSKLVEHCKISLNKYLLTLLNKYYLYVEKNELNKI